MIFQPFDVLDQSAPLKTVSSSPSITAPGQSDDIEHDPDPGEEMSTHARRYRRFGPANRFLP